MIILYFFKAKDKTILYFVSQGFKKNDSVVTWNNAHETHCEYSEHGRTGHIFIVVAAGFPSRSTPLGGHPQAGLSADLGVAARKAATDSKFTINSYF